MKGSQGTMHDPEVARRGPSASIRPGPLLPPVEVTYIFLLSDQVGSALPADPPDVVCLRITARKALCPSKSFMLSYSFIVMKRMTKRNLVGKGLFCLFIQLKS